MGGNLKKLSSKIFSDKKVLIFSLGLVLFLSAVPFAANASLGSIIFNAFFNGLGNLISSIADIAVGTIAALFKFFAELVANAMEGAIDLFISIPVSPANPNTPEMIKASWNISQNLVNIFFILILAFIGLATILRLQTYQYQKTLPSLLIIALLVNFSGVLVGFIVDMGNIFTKALLGLSPALGNWSLSDIPAFGGAPALAKHVVEIIYYIISLIVYFTVILLFGLRTIILWMLVILAPLAFGAYILPNTKSWWSQWWKQLIQWSIIGIPISFTLVFSKMIMGAAGEENGWTNLFSANAALMGLMAPFTALVFLIVGIGLSMQMAPAGAQGVINFGKKAGLRTAAWAGREGWRNIAKGKKIEELSGRVRQWGQDTSMMAGLEKEQAQKDGKLNLWTRSKLGLKSVTGKAVGAGAFGAQMGSAKINEGIRAKDRSELEKEQKAVGTDSKKGMDRIRKGLKTPGLRNWSQFVGDVTQIIKNGDADDIEKAIARGEIDRSLLPKLYKNAMENGNIPEARMMAKAFLGRSLGKDNEMGVSEDEQEKILDKTTADDLKNMASENLDVHATGEKGEMAKRVVDTMLLKGDSQLVPAMLKMKKKQREAIWGHIQSKGAQWFIDNGREDTLRWSASTAARGMGLGSIDNLTDAQVKTMIERKGSELSTEQLKERMGRLQDSLSQIPQGKQRNATQTQINRLQEEIGLRDENSNPSDTLSQKKETLETRIRELENKEGKTADEYKERAAKERELRPVIRELRRRGKSETSAAPEEEPLAVQIDKLKKQEEGLKKQKPNLYGYARDRANKELREKSAKLKELEKDFQNQPQNLQNLENAILDIREGNKGKSVTGIKEYEGELSIIDGSIKAANDEAKEIGINLEAARKAQNGPAISELERQLKRNQDSLKVHRGNRDKMNQALTEAREHLKGLMADWTDYHQAEPEKFEAGADQYRTELKAAMKKQGEAWQKLSSIRIQKAGPKETADAEKALAEANQNRGNLERKLAHQLLKDKQGSFNQTEATMRRDLERASDNIDSIKRELDSSSKELPIRDQGVREIEQDRAKMLKQITDEISLQAQEEQLRLHPEMKVVPRDFLNRLVRTRVEKDIRHEALSRQLANAKKGLSELKEKIASRKRELSETKKRRTMTQTEYDNLTKEKAQLEETLIRIEKEEIAPKLSKEEKKNLE